MLQTVQACFSKGNHLNWSPLSREGRPWQKGVDCALRNAPFSARASALAKKELPMCSTSNRFQKAAPVVAAEIGHDVLVLAFLHHGDLLLDRRDVITCRQGKGGVT